MQLDSEIVSEASARIESKLGPHIPKLRAGRPAMAVLSEDRVARVINYVNANRAMDDTAALERAFGTNDLLSLYYFWAGLRAARSVGRIQIPPGPGERGGFATGFMIAPNLLLTNWHVFKTEDTAKRSRVQFSYEAGSDGNERVPTWFALLPGRFFLTHKDLDYCVVAVDPDSRQGPEPLESFGWLRLNPQLGKADYGQFLSIIQHPGGESKQVAVRENQLLPFEDADNHLTYRSDTFRGSSGSPVFNDLWDVVALHHSGKPKRDAQGRYIGHDGNPITDRLPEEHEVQWEANEGIRASRVVADFLLRAARGEHRDVADAAFNGGIQPKLIPIDTEIADETKRYDVRSEPITGQQPPSPPERGFTISLPLNVSVRVESLDRPVGAPVAIPSAQVLPAVAPARLDAEELEFEKLNFDPDYSDRAGYDEDFLGRERSAPMPTIDRAHAVEVAPTKKRGKILHYHHFSVMVHAKRKMPVLSACNTDYSKGQRKISGRETFGKDEWIIDDRMDENFQLPRGFYDRWKKLDYGHLVRRDDNCWGASKREIEFANADTFHLTNCTPQHEAFNRDMFQHHGLWGRLENLISRQSKKDKALKRLCIFAGPVFTTKDLKLEDREIGNVFAPLSFWKVIVAPADRGGTRAFGFIVSQKDDLDADPPFTEFEEFTPGAFKDYQASLAEIESKTIVRFGQVLKRVDVMKDHPSGQELMEISGAEEVFLG